MISHCDISLIVYVDATDLCILIFVSCNVAEFISF